MFRIMRQSMLNFARTGLPRLQMSTAAKEYFLPQSVFVNELKPVMPQDIRSMPIYQAMGYDGNLINKDASGICNFSDEQLLSMYRHMVSLKIMDDILYQAQRQGRISFYMTHYGEEAALIGSASALDPQDLVYGQYREAGVLRYRGFTLDQLMNQCYSNALDPAKGRQMPVHYGSKDLHFSTISSPLGTQLPIAVGSAHSFKLAKKPNVVICYFGEGAASEGDAHAAFNFAATLACPIIFFCRNNGYAISTSAKEQYAGDGIAGRGVALGMTTMRVDGNDLFAVHHATKEARKLALDGPKPVLIEVMSYRVGHHSTSDDSSAYREISEVEAWNKENNPIQRFRLYLESKSLWNEEKEASLRKEERESIIQAFHKAEKVKKPAPLEMYSDVFKELTPALIRQRQETQDHLKQYESHYDLQKYE